MIRKATYDDLESIERLFLSVTSSESMTSFCGWEKGIYPTRQTAISALERGDLFAYFYENEALGCAVINQIQAEEYKSINWEIVARDREIISIHTLCVAPKATGRGIARAMLSFANSYGKSLGAIAIRLDTSKSNLPAQSLYKSFGFEERGETHLCNSSRLYLCLEAPIK